MEPLTKIFGSAARLRALRLFLFNQNNSFTLAEIAARTKLSVPAVRREISDLVASGLLRKRGTRSAARFQVNQHFEHLVPLDAFIRDTTNLRPKDILTSLRRVGALHLVVLTGLFIGTVESSVDLLVVGEHLDERILAGAVRSLEAELGREIRYSSFTTVDFRYRYGVYDRLLRDIFDYPHRILIDKVGL